MSAEFGPYVQMRTLAERMAMHYHMDANLALEPHLLHYMEEVEVNISADRFDHAGFMDRIRTPLKQTMEATAVSRRRDFLHAVVEALQVRIDRHSDDLA